MKDDVDDETSEKRKDTDGQAPPSTDTCNLRTRLQLYVCICVQDCNLMCPTLQPYLCVPARSCTRSASSCSSTRRVRAVTPPSRRPRKRGSSTGAKPSPRPSTLRVPSWWYHGSLACGPANVAESAASTNLAASDTQVPSSTKYFVQGQDAVPVEGSL